MDIFQCNVTHHLLPEKTTAFNYQGATRSCCAAVPDTISSLTARRLTETTKLISSQLMMLICRCI